MFKIPSALGWVFALSLLLPRPLHAGAIEDAEKMVEEGDKILKTAKKKRGKKKSAQLVEALKKYSRAYLLITARNLQHDAPDLFEKINQSIQKSNEMTEIQDMRRDFLSKAIDAASSGELTKAYDHLATLRDLDPRDSEVEYSLSVIGQRMEGG
ncbi:hypothetical protein KKB55_06135 [Myxococcota bacterium]|nr:hypothetical protein [Myxococcota bacterium]